MADQPNILRASAPTPQPTARRQSSIVSPLESGPTNWRRDSEVSVVEEEEDDYEPPSRYGVSRREISPVGEDDGEIVVHTWGVPRSVPALPALPPVEEDEMPLMTPTLQRPPTFGYEQAHAGVRDLMSKIGSVRMPGASKRPGKQEYAQLEEEDNEPVGFDLSGFEGPMGPGHMGATPRELEMGSLKPRRVNTLSIGNGMENIMNASVTVGHRRGHSLANAKVEKAVQQKADELGEILAIDEIPMDISGFEGDAMAIRGSVVETPLTTKEKSYLFPVEANKPSWRPISMRIPYISVLILIAFGFAGLQEFLCQLSIKRTADNDGLLKFTSVKEIPVYTYFAWKYLPTILLVTYGIMWQITDFEVKRLEPYYQLSKREGATASQSLNLDYLTMLTYVIPLYAAGYKQWAVLWSSTATLLAGSVLVVLQAASISTYPRDATGDEPKFVRLDPVWSRLLTSAAGLVGVMGICLVLSLRRKSGLLSDPKGIAGIASMAVKSHILQDFEGLDTATNNVIHNKLRKRRYNLHNSTLWQGRYITNSEKKISLDKVENPHPIMLRRRVGIPFLIYIVAVTGIIPGLIFTSSINEIIKKVPFLLTALATVTKLLWGCLDITLRVMEPYYILSRRFAPAKTLTLDYTGTVPGYLSYLSFRNQHWLVCLVGLGSIFAEVLTVCATSLTVDGRKFVSGHGGDGSEADDRMNTTETFRSFWISFAISMFVCIYLTVIGSITYLRRSRVFLPRQPGSISSVLAYIHQSNMLGDFIDTELMDSNAMTKHLTRLGKTYGIGWFRGRDGQDHCGVDQETLLSAYKHGFDFSKTRMAGEDVAAWQHL